MQPDVILPYLDLTAWYLYNNQMEEAKAVYKQAEAKKLDGDFVREVRLMIAYAESDTAEMERQIAWSAGKPDEIDFTLYRGMIAAQRGRMKEARELYQKAFDMATESGQDATAAQTAEERAFPAVEGKPEAEGDHP